MLADYLQGRMNILSTRKDLGAFGDNDIGDIAEINKSYKWVYAKRRSKLFLQYQVKTSSTPQTFT